MPKKIFIVKYAKRPRVKNTLVNFNLSEDILGVLSLYALAHGQTVSNVLRALILTWMKDNQISVNVLSTQLVAIAQKEWNERKAEVLPEFQKVEYIAYKEQMRYELNEKKINTTYIQFILKQITP
jgi:hypothetical protein